MRHLVRWSKTTCGVGWTDNRPFSARQRTKKGGGILHRLFFESLVDLACCNSCCNNNQQNQRQDDTLRRALGFFDNNRCLYNRLFQVARICGRSSSGQCSSENEFLHINLQNLHGSTNRNRTSKTYLVSFSNQLCPWIAIVTCVFSSLARQNVVKLATLACRPLPYQKARQYPR